MKKEKEFDAVKMMRDIRDKLSEKYLKDPEAQKRDLDRINKKYGIKDKEEKKIKPE